MDKNSDIIISDLGHLSMQEIHKTWTDAFSDYVVPIKLSVKELAYVLERRGCDLNISYGAFDGDELVGFILNGIGQWNGKLTAYDTGTGLVKKYRRRGIATRLFNESVPLLRQQGIEQYLLEVIQSNTSAFDLYRKKNFEILREFDCYIFPKSEIQIRQEKLNTNFSVQQIKVPDWNLYKSFWDCQPSWQNSIDSINRKLEHFTILNISDNGKTIGYGIIENETGDIPQMAIRPEYRRQGLASTIMKKLVEHSQSEEIRMINADAGNLAFEKFIKSLNVEKDIGQYEMLLKLNY